MPPSRGRLAAAARAGLFARSRWLVSGAALLAAGAVGWLLAEHLGAELRSLIDDGLAASVELRDDPARAIAIGGVRGLALLASLLVAPVLAGALAAVLPALLARRGSGRTAVPLPARGGRAARLALALVSLVLLSLVALRLLREYAGDAALMARGFESGAGWIGELVAAIVAAGGAVLLLAGLTDLAFERARLLRALRLTRSEALREERAERGDPTAREQIRTQARSIGRSQ